MTDYSELVKALLYCEFGWSARTCDNCEYSKTDCQLLLSDAAAAIEDLQAELGKEGKRVEHLLATVNELEDKMPKRGEWIIHGEPPMLVIECSVCGQKYFNHVMQEKAKYCSMCGAKMEVQDGENES